MTEWCHMIMDKIIQVNLTKIDGMMAFFSYFNHEGIFSVGITYKF